MARIPREARPAGSTSRSTRPGREPPPVPAHPYRGSALFHGVLAVVIVLVAAIVGGGVVRAVVVASLYFVLATAWSWARLSQRIRARDRVAAGAAGSAAAAPEQDTRR